MFLNCGPCVVRAWCTSDEDSLVMHANSRKVWRNLKHRFPHPYTRVDADAWLTYVTALAEPTHWAIEVDGHAVGGVGLDRGQGIYEKSAEFGYWLGEGYWGRGIATAAARAVCDIVFTRFGLVRLQAAVFEWNPASMRVLEKCGFAREGVLRSSVFKDGQIIDSVLFARVLP